MYFLLLKYGLWDMGSLHRKSQYGLWDMGLLFFLAVFQIWVMGVVNRQVASIILIQRTETLCLFGLK